MSFIPAFDRESNRLVLFFARADGTMAYKTDQLETNNRIRGQLRQPDSRVARRVLSGYGRGRMAGYRAHNRLCQ